MIMKQNPTKTIAWNKLQNHYNEIAPIHLNDLFKNQLDRKKQFSINLDDLQYNFSNNKITDATLTLLIELANEMGLKENIKDFFNGKEINQTEKRAVLHTALRSFSDKGIKVKGEPIYPLIEKTRQQIALFTEQVTSGKWETYTGKQITDVVNIGIGGSDLGPKMLVEALDFYRNHLKTHFISNIDGDALYKTLKEINPETTLFIIVSKTFTTIETMTNARSIKKWFLKNAPKSALAKHFVAVSSNKKEAINFGVAEANVFPLWDWVGGRFSMWGSVGLSISLSIGYANFESFLKGAEKADLHFKETPFINNIPVIMALLSIWHTNFFNTKAEAIVPYAESLNKFSAYLQQLFMESNGKSVDKNGIEISYQTGGVVFGSSGSNAQHSFMQLIHQGTQLIPVDFIGFRKALYADQNHHKILMANFKAQAKALRQGKTKEAVYLDMKFKGQRKDINNLLPYKTFKGSKESSSFLFDKLTPNSMGMLVSLYENKVFTQGVIWNINSFDQFGVELGKEMAKDS